MTVKKLIKELKKLPPEANISFESYTESFDAEVMWDITMKEWLAGNDIDEPYIYLISKTSKPI